MGTTITTTTREPTTITTTTTTTKPTQKVVEEPRKRKITAIDQARLCLFEGICDTETAREYFRTSTVTPAESTTSATTARTTTTSRTTTSAPGKGPYDKVNRALLATIQRCIQTPAYCNTNLIPSIMEKDRTQSINLSTTTTKPTTIQTTATTLIDNSLSAKVRRCLFNHICK